MAQSKQDMGSGNVRSLMLQLMIPAVVAQVVNLLYNIVDRIYIGHIAGIGAAALTGVGLFTPILMLLNAFAMLVGAGGAPRTAIALGQGDKKQAEKIISNSFTMLLLFSVVLTISFYAGAPMVLGMNPFITTQGFAKTSMLTTVIGAVINIILDPILIFGFGLGVRGAAIATVLSQAVGAVWILRFLTGKKTLLRLRRDYLRPERTVILPVMALGISTFVMLSTESLLSISFSSSLARYGGDVAVGAMTVITSASQLCTLPIQGICQGGQPVISFNFGADKKPRVKEAFRFQLTLCGVYTCMFWLLMMLVPGTVAGIFTSDSALISYTTWAMRIYMAGIFAMGFRSSSSCRTCCRTRCSACFWPSRSATFWPQPSPPSPSLPGSIKFSTAVQQRFNICHKNNACQLKMAGVIFGSEQVTALRHSFQLPSYTNKNCLFYNV